MASGFKTGSQASTTTAQADDAEPYQRVSSWRMVTAYGHATAAQLLMSLASATEDEDLALTARIVLA